MATTFTLQECPTCGVKNHKPCRTPKGRRKKNVHVARSLDLEGLYGGKRHADVTQDLFRLC